MRLPSTIVNLIQAWSFSQLWILNKSSCFVEEGLSNQLSIISLQRKDICATINTPCETLGLSHVAGMCQPHRSCSISEDTGLPMAFTVAHELGHKWVIAACKQKYPHYNNQCIGQQSVSGLYLHLSSESYRGKRHSSFWSSIKPHPRHRPLTKIKTWVWFGIF